MDPEKFGLRDIIPLNQSPKTFMPFPQDTVTDPPFGYACMITDLPATAAESPAITKDPPDSPALARPPTPPSPTQYKKVFRPYDVYVSSVKKPPSSPTQTPAPARVPGLHTDTALGQANSSDGNQTPLGYPTWIMGTELES